MVIPHACCDLSYLSTLTFVCFFRMTNLYALTMEKNRFTGHLPNEMGLLSNVMYLSFGDNLFSGTIPLSFQNLTHLGTFISSVYIFSGMI